MGETHFSAQMKTYAHMERRVQKSVGGILFSLRCGCELECPFSSTIVVTVGQPELPEDFATLCGGDQKGSLNALRGI